MDQPAAVDTDAGKDPVARVQEWLSAQGIETPERSERPARAPARKPERVWVPNGAKPEAVTELDPDNEPDADVEAVARNIVLRKLSSRACTRLELERVLAKRSVPAQVAAAVLDRMAELRLVDDAAFATDWVASRQQRRHLSVEALRRELTARGVARDEVSQAVAGVDELDEYAAALDLAQRRAPALERYPSQVRYRRLAGVLGRRGFGSSVTARVLREVLTDDA